MTSLIHRISAAPRELKLFALASLFMGSAYSIIDSTLNNFLNERFALTGFQRSFLEFPRELPGFLVVFVSALLWFLCSRRLGAISLLLGAAGALLIGFASSTYTIMVICLFVYSLGNHLIMPVNATIGMELAREGKTGQRLGQLNALRNAAVIAGSFFVLLGFKYLDFQFQHTFVLAAVGLLLAAGLMFKMKSQAQQRTRNFLTLRREYKLYYLMAVLLGSRKQIFLTFAPWVLVTVFEQPVQILATLMTIGGVIGILFQPLLGWLVDHLGEKRVLIAEALIFVPVCFGYGFARDLLPGGAAFYVVCACYLLDQMLLSVNMARTTYMKKIALRPEDIQPALTASVTIDHAFSIGVALLGGVIWSAFGYQYVFLLGVFIAALNVAAALQIHLPLPAASPKQEAVAP